MEHLIFEFRDLLLLHLDIAFALLSFFLIRRKRRMIGVEFALMRNQFLFDFGDVNGKGGDFSRQLPQPMVNFL